MAKKQKAGRLSTDQLRKLINKKAGQEVAVDLADESNPTIVKQWIPTGSRWLDSIICRGKVAGVPVGKVTEIAGLEASGKSYMAAQIAGNAQKMGIDVVYFDSESSLDFNFLEKAGCDASKILYVQATSVEFVLETIEELLKSTDSQFLFIWDSLALTPTISDVEGDFNPQAVKEMREKGYNFNNGAWNKGGSVLSGSDVSKNKNTSDVNINLSAEKGTKMNNISTKTKGKGLSLGVTRAGLAGAY